MKRLHLIISGRVQGVCFRAGVGQEADRLSLKGWVRNLPNQSVEVVAEGPESKLLLLKEWCQHGPSFAHVTKIQATWEESTNEFQGFHIRY